MKVKYISGVLILAFVMAFMLFSNQVMGSERRFIGESFMVTIPAVVELEENEDGTFSGWYEVTIEGLKDGYSIISVVPEEYLLLETVGKRGVEAYVEQIETEFDFSTKQTLSGRVYTTQYIGAGEWTGSLGFKIRAEAATIVASPSDAEETGPPDMKEMEETGPPDTEIEETGAQETGAPDIKETETSGTDIKETETSGTDIKETETSGTEIKGEETSGTEVKETEETGPPDIKETEPEAEAASPSDAEIKGVEEASPSDIKEAETSGTDIKETESAGTEVTKEEGEMG